MDPPRAGAEDYIDFLLATPRVASATEAARVQPDRPAAPAHDAFTRLPARLEPDPATLWEEVEPLVRRAAGILVLDDTVLDKPYAHETGLVAPFWSGKHQRILRGINLVGAAWTDGDAVYPTDYRLVDPAEVPKRIKNDLFREMLSVAKARRFVPAGVCFDAWYSGRETLEELARVAGTRWAIEDLFELAKCDCGLDEYEVRSWVGWHRHVTLSLFALAVLAAIRSRVVDRGRRKKGRRGPSR